MDVNPLLDVGVKHTTPSNHSIKNPEPYPKSTTHCGICNHTFNRPQDLRRHQKATHSKQIQLPQAEVWECLFCGDGFRSTRADAWKRHMVTQHRVEVCRLRTLPDGTKVEYGRKKTGSATSSKPPLHDELSYNGRCFRIKQCEVLPGAISSST